mgnify:CR=1 FL=1
MKRKKPTETDSQATCLAEQIKRFRISVTPGELRLQKDLQGIGSFHNINFEFPQGPSSVAVNFIDNTNICPSRFLVTVPRYYPHNKPILKCLDTIYKNQFILDNYNITHPIIDEWTAMKSLQDIIECLQFIRATFINQSCPHIASNNLVPLIRMDNSPCKISLMEISPGCNI